MGNDIKDRQNSKSNIARLAAQRQMYYHQRMVRRAAFEALPISAEEQEVHFLEIPQPISAETTGASSPGTAPRRARLPAPAISEKRCLKPRAMR